MSLIRKIGRNLRGLNLIVPGMLERAWLSSLHARGDKEQKISLPLIVIVGPPRVGSTLMSQLLASQYQLFYFNNFQHALMRYPYLAFKLSGWLIPDRPIDFMSDHGFVKGLGGLSEGIFFWVFWFDMAVTQNDPQPPISRIEHVSRVLNRIYVETGKPLMTAANTLSFYLTELERRFEKLVIVNMRRDPVATALSLLRGRKAFRSDLREWWSIRPAACVSLEQDPYRQIVCQVVETYRQIKEQRAKIPHVPVVDVHYQDLCHSPQAVLNRIADACRDGAIELLPHPIQSLLPNLSMRGPRQDELEDAERFGELFAQVDLQALWS